MGRREIVITGFFTLLAVGGGAVVTGLSATPNIYTGYLLSVGWLALLIAALGLGYMFRTAPKAAVSAAQTLIEGPPAREFLDADLTPAVFRNKVKNKTDVQIDALAKTYCGKWMKVEGSIYNITNAGSKNDPRWMVHLDDEDGLTTVIFREPWLEQLAALSKDEWLVAVGQITRLNNGPTLADGEILHVGEPPKKAAPQKSAPRKRPIKANARQPALPRGGKDV